MPETLTESFCERCGTRYTFEAAAPSGRRLGRIKVLTKGLANFVMSDDTSFDEAVADARSDQQREMTSHQLDAFHQTFQFCMSCRQYTCANCWNEAEGRCLSCAPLLGAEIPETPFPHLEPVPGPAPLDAAAGSGADAVPAHHPTADASTWPTTDLRAIQKTRPDQVTVPQPSTVAEVMAEVTAAVELAIEPVVDIQAAVDEVAAAEATSVAPAVEEIDEDVTRAVADAERHRAASAAVQVAAAAAIPAAEPGTSESPPAPTARGVGKATGLLGRFLPGRRAPEMAAVEAEVEAVEPAVEAEPVAVEPAVAAVEAEPVAVEPAVAAVEAEPVAVEPAVTAVEPRDEIETPTWRIVAPVDAEPSTPRPDLPRAPLPEPSGPGLRPPQWPMPAATPTPQWPSRPAATPPMAPSVDLWAVSSQDVLNRPGSGVQACVSCGLPLSATARFCRRCGSQQH